MANSRTVLATACNRDCPDACAMQVTVENDRAVRLQGDARDPVTRGFLCERTSRFLERQYSAERFLKPRLRRGDRWVEISTDAALDYAAEQLTKIKAEWGPAAILHYRSGGSLGILKVVADAVFERFGPVTVKCGDICSGAGENAQILDFGISDSHDLHDLHSSALILIWGKNPHVSGPHLLPVLREARRRGTQLIGIDPIRTPVSAWCEHFLQPRPGTDRFLAMALARHAIDCERLDPFGAQWCDGWERFLEQAKRESFQNWCAPTGLHPREVMPVAEAYAQLAPAAILVGWGMQRRRDGGAMVRMLDALGALRGNLGVKGGGVSFYFGRRTPFETGFATGAAARRLSEPLLGQEILAAKDPPIQAIWVTAGNPISMLPDAHRVREAFARAQFKVVVDTHPTDTTDVADLVFPTCTLLEDEDLLGAYGNHQVRSSRPVIAPPPGVLHEYLLFVELAERLGLKGFLPPTVEEAKRFLLRRLAPHGIDLDTLAASPGVRNPLAPKVLFENRQVPTANGRVRLIENALPEPQADASRDYPLMLQAISDARVQASQWTDELRQRTLECRVNPRSTDLLHGATAWLESAHGRLEVEIVHDEKVHCELVVVPKGGMLRDGKCANALIAARETDLGQGACYYDEPVRLIAR